MPFGGMFMAQNKISGGEKFDFINDNGTIIHTETIEDSKFGIIPPDNFTIGGYVRPGHEFGTYSRHVEYINIPITNGGIFFLNNGVTDGTHSSGNGTRTGGNSAKNLTDIFSWNLRPKFNSDGTHNHQSIQPGTLVEFSFNKIVEDVFYNGHFGNNRDLSSDFIERDNSTFITSKPEVHGYRNLVHRIAIFEWKDSNAYAIKIKTRYKNINCSVMFSHNLTEWWYYNSVPDNHSHGGTSLGGPKNQNSFWNSSVRVTNLHEGVLFRTYVNMPFLDKDISGILVKGFYNPRYVAIVCVDPDTHNDPNKRNNKSKMNYIDYIQIMGSHTIIEHTTIIKNNSFNNNDPRKYCIYYRNTGTTNGYIDYRWVWPNDGSRPLGPNTENFSDSSSNDVKKRDRGIIYRDTNGKLKWECIPATDLSNAGWYYNSNISNQVAQDLSYIFVNKDVAYWEWLFRDLAETKGYSNINIPHNFNFNSYVSSISNINIQVKNNSNTVAFSEFGFRDSYNNKYDLFVSAPKNNNNTDEYIQWSVDGKIWYDTYHRITWADQFSDNRYPNEIEARSMIWGTTEFLYCLTSEDPDIAGIYYSTDGMYWARSNHGERFNEETTGGTGNNMLDSIPRSILYAPNGERSVYENYKYIVYGDSGRGWGAHISTQYYWYSNDVSEFTGRSPQGDYQDVAFPASHRDYSQFNNPVLDAVYYSEGSPWPTKTILSNNNPGMDIYNYPRMSDNRFILMNSVAATNYDGDVSKPRIVYVGNNTTAYRLWNNGNIHTVTNPSYETSIYHITYIDGRYGVIRDMDTNNNNTLSKVNYNTDYNKVRWIKTNSTTGEFIVVGKGSRPVMYSNNQKYHDDNRENSWININAINIVPGKNYTDFINYRSTIIISNSDIQ
jgi:hypothetical protein